jgi:arsenate reductase
MAEGLARASAPEGWEVHSAGSEPSALNPLAVQALDEVGIDISHHHSKGFDAAPLADADLVVTLCAEEECPLFATAGRRLSWPLPDPAAPARTPKEQLERFRKARDEIGARLERLWAALRESP